MIPEEGRNILHSTNTQNYGQLQFQLSDLWRINNIALKRAYESNFLSTNPLFIDTNSLVLATPTKHILFDTGNVKKTTITKPSSFVKIHIKYFFL